jgi:hypothetical protein
MCLKSVHLKVAGVVVNSDVEIADAVFEKQRQEKRHSRNQSICLKYGPLEKSVGVFENVNLYNLKVTNVSSAVCLRQGLLMTVFAITLV